MRRAPEFEPAGTTARSGRNGANVPSGPMTMAAVRRWPLWRLRPVTFACVLAVPAVAAVTIGVAAAGGPWHVGDLLRFLALAGCGLAAFEATRSVTATRDPLIPDQLAVWCLPIAVLLPPFWALVAPIPLLAFAQVRVHHATPHRRVYGAAASGLAYGAASVTFHSVSSGAVGVTSPAPGTGTHALAWTLLVAGCGIVSWIVASGLAALAPAAGPGSQPYPLVPRRDTVFGDFVQLSLGVAVTIVVAINPLLVIFAAPSILVQRRLLTIHSELVDRARTDAKTGLLNARAWEAAAEAEVARARRTGSPLAVAIADVDHFKLINDTHGHLAGDRVLKEIAGVFRATVREYDLPGRFGGEEFALLFPDTNGADAVRVAERLRSRIASLRVTADDAAGSPPVSVTISVGVATADTAGTGEAVLSEALAAADTALYQGKDAGRNMVCRYRGAGALPDPRFPVTHTGQQAARA
jgi:diguanylate cyclase (GGDEF)-like protein